MPFQKLKSSKFLKKILYKSLDQNIKNNSFFDKSIIYQNLNIYIYIYILTLQQQHSQSIIFIQKHQMGAQQPKGPVIPEKTMKEQVKQYTKEIQKMRREYAREKYRLEYQGKTLNRDLKKKIQKKQSAQAKKMVAQQILKNNQMIGKYDKLDGQLQNVQFELQQMAVNQSMQNVMGGMAKIMSGASNKMKSADYQDTMKRFMTQKQRMNVLNQYVQDVMNTDEQQIEDQDVDKLINQMTHQAVAKKQKQVQMDQQMDLDDYENNLKDI